MFGEASGSKWEETGWGSRRAHSRLGAVRAGWTGPTGPLVFGTGEQ